MAARENASQTLKRWRSILLCWLETELISAGWDAEMTKQLLHLADISVEEGFSLLKGECRMLNTTFLAFSFLASMKL
eukprot:6200707-Pleurochrysis_carterae.AAC.7